MKISALFFTGTGTCVQQHCGSGVPVSRTCDGNGCGYFGASRYDVTRILASFFCIYTWFYFRGGGTRSHNGNDIVCADNEWIRAPFKGRVTRRANPYGNGVCVDDGFEFESTDDVTWPGEYYQKHNSKKKQNQCVSSPKVSR